MDLGFSSFDYLKEMNSRGKFDVGIIGGGLAGLAAAIELNRSGYSVALFEKNEFPFHKVCGEYLSMEAWDYLKYLGIKPEEHTLPKINQLKISTPKGVHFEKKLSKGGFGISRYFLDCLLYERARSEGVKVFQKTEIIDCTLKNKVHEIKSKTDVFHSNLLLGAYGKRSKMDKSLKRKFIQKSASAQQNFIGIKYHIKADLDSHKIGLHLFKNGYGGISKVEGENRFCLCYLTLASNLKKQGSIAKMEKNVLYENPFLRQYLQLERWFDPGISIAQVYFQRKSLLEDGIFMLGDAAEMISPLSGNGMSIAMHTAHQFSALAHQHLIGSLSKMQLEAAYRQWWNEQFKRQLQFGRWLQKLFFQPLLIKPVLQLLNQSNFLSEWVIKQTHGEDIL